MHLAPLPRITLATLLALTALAAPVSARVEPEPPAFGASDAFGTGFATLSDSQRRELTARVVPLLTDLGVQRLRLTFGEHDTPFAWGDVEAHLDEPRLYVLDELIGALVAAGIEPVIVLSAENAADHPATTLLPVDTAAWKAFVKLIVERYDGDVDFGLNGCAGPYPNIDADQGSEECSSYDAHSADDSVRLAWARRHRVRHYQLEDSPFARLRADGVPVTEYGQLVALTVPWMRSLVPAELDLRIVLGGVRFATENRGDFVQALAPLVAAGDAARPDAADVFALVPEGDTFTGEAFEAVVHGPKGFGEWLQSAGLAGLPFQVGRFTASAGRTATYPWQAGDGPKGTCHGRLCSPRSQVEGLVKGLTRMSWRSRPPVFFSNVLEFVGQGEVDEGQAWHGLLVERGDSAVTTTDVTPRPAAIVLAWLADEAPALFGGEVVEVFPVPANTHVFRLPDAAVPTWIAWYDWVREVPAGGEYLGITKNLDLVDVPTPALRVTTLYAEPPALALPAPRWVPVSGGAARVEVAREILLLQGGDEVPPEPEVAPEVVDAVGDVAVEPPDAGSEGGGGCAAVPGRARRSGEPWLPGATALALVLGSALWPGRARSRSRGPAGR